VSTPPIPPQPGTPATPQPGYEQVIVPPLPPAAAAYPPAPSNMYAQPGYGQMVPPKSSNTVLKIVLIVVGVFVIFGVLAAAVIGFGAYKLSKAVHRSGNGDVSFSTPGGTISTGNSASISSADLGLPAYPGAKRSTGGMRMKTPNGSLITATFTTSDSASQVVDFYKSKMGDDATSMETGSSTMLSSGQNSHDKKVVTVSEHDGVTKIAIVHTTSTQ
jgi:hypothetical protein